MLAEREAPPQGFAAYLLCGWSDPWLAWLIASGLTLPVDSRHKTGTGEVAEWLKAALC